MSETSSAVCLSVQDPNQQRHTLRFVLPLTICDFTSCDVSMISFLLQASMESIDSLIFALTHFPKLMDKTFWIFEVFICLDNAFLAFVNCPVIAVRGWDRGPNHLHSRAHFFVFSDVQTKQKVFETSHFVHRCEREDWSLSVSQNADLLAEIHPFWFVLVATGGGDCSFQIRVMTVTGENPWPENSLLSPRYICRQ